MIQSPSIALGVGVYERERVSVTWGQGSSWWLIDQWCDGGGDDDEEEEEEATTLKVNEW